MRSQLHLLAAAAALTLGVGAASAQQATTGAAAVTGLHEAEDDAMMVQPFNLSVDRIEDMDLHASNGDEIGEVEEVLLDGSGQPVAVSADVGGFLGMGDKTVVMGLDQIRYESDRLVTGMSKEQIEALPEWDDDD